jgi:hypothetical protein
MRAFPYPEPAVMAFKPLRIVPLTVLLAVALPAVAASSASSASSEAGSASVGSISTSFEKSSNSSSGEEKTAAGDYRIIEVAEAPARPGTVRLKLQPVAADGATQTAQAGEFFLYMPREAAEQSRLETGHVVTASARPYGLAFARSDAPKPFFLVMFDDWYRELKTQVVKI